VARSTQQNSPCAYSVLVSPSHADEIFVLNYPCSARRCLAVSFEDPRDEHFPGLRDIRHAILSLPPQPCGRTFRGDDPSRLQRQRCEASHHDVPRNGQDVDAPAQHTTVLALRDEAHLDFGLESRCLDILINTEPHPVAARGGTRPTRHGAPPPCCRSTEKHVLGAPRRAGPSVRCRASDPYVSPA